MSILMIANGLRLLFNFCLGIRNKFSLLRLRLYPDFFRGRVFRPMPIPTFANANITTLRYLIINCLKNRKKIGIYLVDYILRNKCLQIGLLLVHIKLSAFFYRVLYFRKLQLLHFYKHVRYPPRLSIFSFHQSLLRNHRQSRHQ